MKSFAGNKSSLSLKWYGLMLELFCGHDMRQRDTTLPANLCGFDGKEKDRYAKTKATIELETIVTYIQEDTRNIYLKQSYKKHLWWTCHVHDLGLMISRNKQRKKHIFLREHLSIKRRYNKLGLALNLQNTTVFQLYFTCFSLANSKTTCNIKKKSSIECFCKTCSPLIRNNINLEFC